MSSTSIERINKLYDQIDSISHSIFNNYEFKDNQSTIIVADPATDSRYDFMINTLNLIKKSNSKELLLGHGAGNFGNVYNSTITSDQLQTSDPHNQYLKILVENGLIGLIIFIIILSLIIFRWQDNQISVNILIIWLITSLFNSHFSTFAEGTLIWALLGFFYNFNNSKFDDSI
jgi:pheromone shutdown protein TraB